MLDKTDVAELIEHRGLTVQYTIVDGVARLLLGGRDEEMVDFVDRVFSRVEASVENDRNPPPEPTPAELGAAHGAWAAEVLRNYYPPTACESMFVAFLAHRHGFVADMPTRHTVRDGDSFVELEICPCDGVRVTDGAVDGFDGFLAAVEASLPFLDALSAGAPAGDEEE